MVPKSATVFGLFVQGIESCGLKAHGGKDSPYVFVDLDGRPSWDVFSEILEKAQVGNTRVRCLARWVSLFWMAVHGCGLHGVRQRGGGVLLYRGWVHRRPYPTAVDEFAVTGALFCPIDKCVPYCRSNPETTCALYL